MPMTARGLNRWFPRLSGLPIIRHLIVLTICRDEVRRATKRGALGESSGEGPDSLRPADIPSSAELGIQDRTLAEIDQDGFMFAAETLDEARFNRRERKQPRWRYQIDIVLLGGRVLLRKRQLGYPPWFEDPWDRLCCALGLRFYLEAAALLRLREMPGFPSIRRIDPASRSIYLDYIYGENLKHVLAHSGATVHNLDIHADPELSRVPWPDRIEREFKIFREVFAGRFDAQIRSLVAAANRAGVALLDLPASNFILGRDSGRLYLVDFECCWLDSLPRWEFHRDRQDSMIRQWFRMESG
jgi:hypothetical protein